MAGYDVSLNSRTEESLQKGINDIKADLQRLVDFEMATREQTESALTKIRTNVEDIDTVIKTGHSRRWVVSGIFEMVEIIAGWDLALAAMPDVMADMDSSIDVLEPVREKVERGELGAKTGKGFYDWTPESAEAARQKMAQAFIEIEKWSQPGH